MYGWWYFKIQRGRRTTGVSKTMPLSTCSQVLICGVSLAIKRSSHLVPDTHHRRYITTPSSLSLSLRQVSLNSARLVFNPARRLRLCSPLYYVSPHSASYGENLHCNQRHLLPVSTRYPFLNFLCAGVSCGVFVCYSCSKWKQFTG